MVKQKQSTNLGWFLIIASSLLFGLNAGTSKVLVHAGFEPNFIVGFRSVATGTLALILVLIKNPKSLKISWREIPMLVLFGVVGIMLLQWTYTNAVARLPVGIALLIEYSSAVVIPIVDWLLFRKKAGRGIWLGIAFAMVGVLTVSQIWHTTLDGLGLLFGFGALACATFYFLINEHIQTSRDSYSTLFYTMVASALCWNLLTRPQLSDQPDLTSALNLGGNLAGIQVPMWFGLLWLGVVGSFLPMLLNFMAMRHITATDAGLASISEVVFAFLFGALWLGEGVSGIQFIGAVFVIAGIVFAQRSTAVKTQTID